MPFDGQTPTKRAHPHVPGAKCEPVPITPKATVDHIQPLTRTALAVMLLTEVLTDRRPGS